MKKLITICLMMATIIVVNAQAHTTKGGYYACSLVPKSLGSEKYRCPACAKIDEQKRIAKIADDKKRSDAVAAKSKATQLATDAAHKKEMAELADKNKVTEVKVVMPKSSNTSSSNNKNVDTKPNNNKKIKSKNETLMIAHNGGFKNINNEMIIPENTFLKTKAAEYYDNVGRYKFPNNLGIVSLNDKIDNTQHPAWKRGNGKYNVMDFINVEGKRYFNSTSISFIDHLYGDWFLIGHDFYEVEKFGDEFYLGKAKIYNIKTKKEFELPISPNNKCVKICRTNSYIRLLHQNYDYINGVFDLNKNRRYSDDVVVDNISGGRSKWLAYILVSTQQADYQEQNNLLYYINDIGEIKEQSLTKQQYIDLFK